MATRGKKAPEGDPLAHLSEGGPRQVYALDGDERFLVDEALAAIKNAALAPRARDFNLDVLDAKDAPIARVIDAANTLPAFAPLRVVVVKEAQRYEDKSGGDSRELELLAAYLAKPSPTTVLIFVAAQKLDGRLKLYKLLSKAGALIRFSHPAEREMPQVVQQRAKAMGLKLDQEAGRALVDAIGASIGGVIEALEKLALYVGPAAGGVVTRRDVEEVVSPAKEESIFELSDAVGGRDLARAFELLHAMLEVSRAHPLQLLALLAGHWRRLILARSLGVEGRGSRDELITALKVPPFVVERLVTQARRQPLPALISGLEAIAAADRALKGGKLEHARVMERLVMGLTGAGRAVA